MISRLKCKLGLHDADLVPVDRREVYRRYINNHTIERINTYYWKCKRCGWEKEIGK